MAVEGRTEKVDSVDASKILDSSAAVNKSKQTETAAESEATLSLVFGLLSIVGGFSGTISLAFAIAGLILAQQAKKKGYDDNIRKVGLISSIIGIVLSAFALLIIILFLLGIIGMGVFTTLLSMLGIWLSAASHVII